MRFTETVTIYNKIPQQGREPEKFRRTVVHGVFWDYTTGAAFGKLGKDDSDSITVMIAPYAHKQYYRNGKLKGKRGSRWFHRMWAACKDTIVREVKNYARRLMP